MRSIAALHALLVFALWPSPARAGIEHRRIERAGSGEVPHEADELTYRLDFAWKGQPVEHTEHTERGSEIALNDGYRHDLLAMRVGEVRRFSGHDVDYLTCDHFGCGPEQAFTARLELVAVTSHHDALPGGLRIAANPLRVVDGAMAAELPGDHPSTIREVRLKNGVVSIEVTYEPGARVATVTFAVDELRARLLDARARRVLAQDARRAKELAEQALAIWPDLDDARVHLAAAQLRTDGSGVANGTLLDVANANPVWLAWKVRADRDLAPLRMLSVVSALDHDNGELDATATQEQSLVVLADPTGAFLAAYARPTYGGDVMRIFSRASGDLVTSIPVRCEVSTPVNAGAIERCESETVGARTLRRLGFAPIAESSDDSQTVRVDELRITRRIQKDPRTSEIVVQPAPTRSIPSVVPPPASPPPTPRPNMSSAASDVRPAPSSSRAGGAGVPLCLLAFAVLADIVFWRRVS